MAQDARLTLKIEAGDTSKKDLAGPPVPMGSAATNQPGEAGESASPPTPPAGLGTQMPPEPPAQPAALSDSRPEILFGMNGAQQAVGLIAAKRSARSGGQERYHSRFYEGHDGKIWPGVPGRC
jgi:hypothetical protein